MMLLVITALLAALPALANNITCYYPNGKIAKDSFPCGGITPMCCPLNWECLDNGLCRNSVEGTFGRYSCTDQSFNPDAGCPQNCVRKESLMGNEDVRICSTDTGCCNLNGAGDCCSNLKSALTFNYGAGNTIALISATAGSSPTTSSSAPSDSSTADTNLSSSTSSAAPSMLAGPPQANSRSTSIPSTVATSVRSTTNGNAPVTQTSSTASTTPSIFSQGGATTPGESQGIGKAGIVGIAVAVPLAAAAVAVTSWLLWTRRKRSNRPAPPLNFNPDANEKPHNTFKGGFVAPTHGTHDSYVPSEIDSREVRVPIQPQGNPKVATTATDLPRDETTDTLYPDSQPRYYANQTGASQPMSPTPSGITNVSNDYSEWAVTPRLPQQRWSGSTAQGSVTIGGGATQAASTGGDGEGVGAPQAHELMGRPQIPQTIHELP